MANVKRESHLSTIQATSTFQYKNTLSNYHHSPTNITLQQGETLFKYLKNVSVPKKEGGPPIGDNHVPQ